MQDQTISELMRINFGIIDYFTVQNLLSNLNHYLSAKVLSILTPIM